MITFSTRVGFFHGDIVGVKIFIISGTGYWMVHPHLTKVTGWMRSEEIGLPNPPRTGWQYYDGTTWVSDETLQLFF